MGACPGRKYLRALNERTPPNRFSRGSAVYIFQMKEYIYSILHSQLLTPYMCTNKFSVLAFGQNLLLVSSRGGDGDWGDGPSQI